MSVIDTTLSPDTLRIRHLNDQLRMFYIGGRVIITRGVSELPEETQRRVLGAVCQFSDFTEDNDPHGEHDFGSVTVENRKFFWKIDYYAPDLMHGSEDPSDPRQTVRVMTIMQAHEY